VIHQYRCIVSSISISVLFLALGCSSTIDTTTYREELDLPPHWEDADDRAASSAQVNWRTFFGDAGLIALIDTAMRNNIDMLTAHERIEGSRADVLQADGALLPMLDAYVSAGQTLMSDNSIDWAGTDGVLYPNGDAIGKTVRDYRAGIAAFWEVDVWGKLRTERRSAIARYLESVEGRNNLVTRLVSDVASTWYDLIALDMKSHIIRESTQLREQALDMVRLKMEAGTVNDLAVRQFEAQVLASKSLELELRQETIAVEALMNIMLNRFPVQIARSPTFPDESIVLTMHMGTPAALLDNRPDIRQAEYALASAELGLAAAQKALYPSLHLGGILNFNSFSAASLFMWPQSLAYEVLGNITAPLFNRSAIKADIARAESFLRQARLHYRGTVVSAFTEVGSQSAMLSAQGEILELRKSRAESLVKAVSSSMELFRSGKASYLEVLLSEQDALEARLDLVDARRKQYESMITMYRTLGGGWRLTPYD
jgi:outer membrane protein, multidrug efflux system